MRRLVSVNRLSHITFVVAAVLSSLAQAASEPAREPGVMLRDGVWSGDVGSYLIPSAFVGAKPAAWPIDGWTRLTIKADRIEREPVLLPTNSASKKPEFLKSIIEQIERSESADGQMNAVSDAVASQAADAGNIVYLRVPGLKLKPGTSSVYLFKNGTSSLRPKLDYRYELSFGKQKFALTVQNGLRTKTGATYGDGAQYTIEYDGKTFEYSLGEFGWDSSIQAIADIDGDGKPDFIISVGGNNSGYEAILLSSTAKPGKNLPTASLTSMGC
jgi:hypothetical protein